MPTDTIERRLTFTPEEVIKALTAMYPQIPTTFTIHVYTKGSRADELVSLQRPLESLTLLSYDPND